MILADCFQFGSYGLKSSLLLAVVHHYPKDKNNSKAMEFACDQCENKSKTKRQLIIHHRSMHMGKKHPCGECDYQATRKSSLITHQHSVNMGKRYPCAECNFQAAQKGNLIRH